MNQDGLLQIIESNLSTTELMVSEAKTFLSESKEPICRNSLDSLMASREVSIPSHLYLMGKTDQEAGEELAKAISWRNAGARALWILQGQGICIPTDNEIPDQPYYVQYTSGSSHQSSTGSINFGHLLLQTVKYVRWFSDNDTSLSNSDIFLRNVDIESLSEGVGIDLKQSVECFRRELYLPCMVMLGRAVEGAWIHVGEAIAQVGNDKSINEILIAQINDPFIGITGKVNHITEQYKQKNNFGKLHHHSKVTPKLLAAIKQWSEQILEYRNAIHPKAEQAISYNYENVSVILLSVKSNLEKLDTVVQQANSLLAEKISEKNTIKPTDSKSQT